MRKTRVLLSIATLLLVGCVNNFEKNYTALRLASNLNNRIQSVEPVQIIISKDLNLDLKKYQQKGYVPIGKSEFKANQYQRIDDIKKQAITIGAQLTIVYRKDLGTSTYSLPVTTPTIDYSTSTSNFNVYSNNNTDIAKIHGQTNTISYGSKTNYIPMTSNHGEYTAIYLAKFESNTGIVPKELSALDKQVLGSNSGVVVDVVIDDSPAYYQNIIENDIILKVNNIDIFGVKGFEDILNKQENGKLQFEIFRQGRLIKKELVMSK